MSAPPTASDSGFVSPLAPQLARFLALKHAMGYRYREVGRALRELDRFLKTRLSAADPLITPAIIHDYVARRGTESETTRAHRLTLIRKVCRFLRLDDPRVVVPDRRSLRIVRRKFVPRVLSKDESRRLLHLCPTAAGARVSHTCDSWHRAAPPASRRVAAAYAGRPRCRRRRAAYPSQQVQQVAGGAAHTRSGSAPRSVPHCCGRALRTRPPHTPLFPSPR